MYHIGVCNFIVITIIMLVVSATTPFENKNAQQESKGQGFVQHRCDFVRPSAKSMHNYYVFTINKTG